MEMVWLDKEGAAALPGPVLGLLLFMAVELRSKLALCQQIRQELCWPARNPVLLLSPGCQAINIKIRDMDSRPLCDRPTYFF